MGWIYLGLWIANREADKGKWIIVWMRRRLTDVSVEEK